MTAKDAYTGPLSPEYALLGFLSLRPAHGYELHQRLRGELGEVWHISLSQTYSILKRLEAQGLIAGDVQEQEKLPARRQFRLTPAGQQRFAGWLHATSGCSVRAIRVEFLTRLYFARLASHLLAQEVIEAQIRETQSGLAQLEAREAGLPPEQIFNRLGLDLRIRQLASIVEWLDQCRLDIQRPA